MERNIYNSSLIIVLLIIQIVSGFKLDWIGSAMRPKPKFEDVWDQVWSNIWVQVQIVLYLDYIHYLKLELAL